MSRSPLISNIHPQLEYPEPNPASITDIVKTPMHISLSKELGAFLVAVGLKFHMS